MLTVALVNRWPTTVPRNVGVPPISPSRARRPHDARVPAAVIGATMPKPSVPLCSPNPMTSIRASCISPAAAWLPIASPSAKLCSPMPIAMSRASWVAGLRQPTATAPSGAGSPCARARRATHRSKYTRPSRPTPVPAARTSPSRRAGPHRCSATAPSMGSHACASMSHNRNTRTPIARALSNARIRGIGARSRPIGSPMKIVNPATAPSRAILVADTRRLLDRQQWRGFSLGLPHRPVDGVTQPDDRGHRPTGMRRFLVPVLAALLALTGCAGNRGAEPTAPSSAGFADRAAQVVSAWHQLKLADAWRSGLVPLGELTTLVGSDPGFDEVTKVAYTQGRYWLAGPLPAGAVGGPGRAVPVLTVTSARLGLVALRTSRGTVQVPAWIFTVAEIRVPVARVAVAPTAFAPLPEPSLPADPAIPGLYRVDRVTPTGDRALDVHYVGGACDRTAQAVAVETAEEVVVGIIVTVEPGACTAVGIERSQPLSLAQPLGSRVVLDAASGQPLVPGAAR